MSKTASENPGSQGNPGFFGNWGPTLGFRNQRNQPLSDFLRSRMYLFSSYLCFIVLSLYIEFLYFLIASYDLFVSLLPSLSKSYLFLILLENILA